jgi:16S rRNA G966 N2-methylase RsmD
VNPFTDFDFSLLDSPDFKEDSVREDIVTPILKALGYSRSGENQILSSKKLTHPFVQSGAGKRRHIVNYPDYLLKVNNKFVVALDAKAPNENITSGANVEQAYFYAIHPEIRASLFALCNGRELVVFSISEKTPLIHFRIEEIPKHWGELEALLGPDAFGSVSPAKTAEVASRFDYKEIVPPGQIQEIQKQSAARHFGVHGYFTKQPFKVVQAYIDRFTQPRDLILDPFGGSGVTAVEALMLGRKVIHIDLNPMSVFITKNLLAPVDIGELNDSFKEIAATFQSHAPKTKAAITAALKKYPYPKDIRLMKNADVRSIEQLFTPLQLAQLAYLKSLIKKVKDKSVQGSLLLAFSSTITKINRTYHPSTSRGDNAGDSAAFRYYRFRVAPEPVELDVLETFTTKVKKLIAAKKEIAPFVTSTTIKNSQIYKGTATDLNEIESESIDYIYTDPPYGAKIPYLDLSVMWNSWLDLPVTKKDYELRSNRGRRTKQDQR